MKTVTQNRKGSTATVHISLSAPGSETIVVAGETSDLDHDTGIAGDETVTGATVLRAMYSSGGGSNGYWKITRNGELLAALPLAGILDLTANEITLTQNPTHDIVCTLVGAAEGTLTLSLRKNSNVANNTYLVG